MEFRTNIAVNPSPYKITYNDKVMLIGSCFASSIGEKMESGKMNVMINPSGTVYNPVSVSNTLDIITSGKEFTRDDLYHHDGMWLSFYHYTDFSSPDETRVLEKINSRLQEASAFLKESQFLYITLGTARIFRWKKTGQIVSNCHKIAASDFSSELLTVAEIVEIWTRQLDKLCGLFPSLKIIFTISPVRHLKDGAHGNQVSKSVLFLAVEELLRHKTGPAYFPAYELVMDDLRDYRFYGSDMMHPSESAINYIWEAFSGCYFDSNTLQLWNEAVKITRAGSHRLNTDNRSGSKAFAESMLKRIMSLENRVPAMNFQQEKDHFLKLLNNE